MLGNETHPPAEVDQKVLRAVLCFGVFVALVLNLTLNRNFSLPLRHDPLAPLANGRTRRITKINYFLDNLE